jgi:hypothetical protein
MHVDRWVYRLPTGPIDLHHSVKVMSGGSGTKQLAEYFLRAKLMHDLMHAILEEYKGDLDLIRKESWLEFETYLLYWLAGLFTVVEGFNALKLEDERVQKLFNEHLRHLEQFRHEIFHFTAEKGSGSEVIRNLNWAEELHETLEQHLKEWVTRQLAH